MHTRPQEERRAPARFKEKDDTPAPKGPSWTRPKRPDLMANQVTQNPFKHRSAAFPSLPLTNDTNSKPGIRPSTYLMETSAPVSSTDMNDSFQAEMESSPERYGSHDLDNPRSCHHNFSSADIGKDDKRILWHDLALALQLHIWKRALDQEKPAVAKTALGLTDLECQTIESVHNQSIIYMLSEEKLQNIIMKEYLEGLRSYDNPPTFSDVSKRYQGDLILEGHLYHARRYEFERARKFLRQRDLDETLAGLWGPGPTSGPRTAEAMVTAKRHLYFTNCSLEDDSGYNSAVSGQQSDHDRQTGHADVSSSRARKKRSAQQAFPSPRAHNSMPERSDVADSSATTPQAVSVEQCVTMIHTATSVSRSTKTTGQPVHPVLQPMTIGSATQTTRQNLTSGSAQNSQPHPGPTTPAGQSSNSNSAPRPAHTSSSRLRRNRTREARSSESSGLWIAKKHPESIYGTQRGGERGSEELAYSGDDDSSDVDDDDRENLPVVRPDPLDVGQYLAEDNTQPKRPSIILKVRQADGMAVLRKEKPASKRNRNSASLQKYEAQPGAVERLFNMDGSRPTFQATDLSRPPAASSSAPQGASGSMEVCCRRNKLSPPPNSDQPEADTAPPCLSLEAVSGISPTGHLVGTILGLDIRKDRPESELGHVQSELKAATSLTTSPDRNSNDIKTLEMNQRLVTCRTLSSISLADKQAKLSSTRLTLYGTEDSSSSSLELKKSSSSTLRQTYDTRTPSSPIAPTYSPITIYSDPSRRGSGFVDDAISDIEPLDFLQADITGRPHDRLRATVETREHGGAQYVTEVGSPIVRKMTINPKMQHLTGLLADIGAAAESTMVSLYSDDHSGLPNTAASLALSCNGPGTITGSGLPTAHQSPINSPMRPNSITSIVEVHAALPAKSAPPSLSVLSMSDANAIPGRLEHEQTLMNAFQHPLEQSAIALDTKASLPVPGWSHLSKAKLPHNFSQGKWLKRVHEASQKVSGAFEATEKSAEEAANALTVSKTENETNDGPFFPHTSENYEHYPMFQNTAKPGLKLPAASIMTTLCSTPSIPPGRKTTNKTRKDSGKKRGPYKKTREKWAKEEAERLAREEAENLTGIQGGAGGRRTNANFDGASPVHRDDSSQENNGNCTVGQRPMGTNATEEA